MDVRTLGAAQGRYHWMLQYYMRDAGVALSWVGTGRCLFALDWTDEHYDELLKRMLNACAAESERARHARCAPPSVPSARSVHHSGGCIVCGGAAASRRCISRPCLGVFSGALP